eukprot:s4445_g5.t1
MNRILADSQAAKIGELGCRKEVDSLRGSCPVQYFIMRVLNWKSLGPRRHDPNPFNFSGSRKKSDICDLFCAAANSALSRLELVLTRLTLIKPRLSIRNRPVMQCCDETNLKEFGSVPPVKAQ